MPSPTDDWEIVPEEEMHKFTHGYRPYWETRWTHSDKGGDGTDTYGELAQAYHRLVYQYGHGNECVTQLDVGCGACNQWTGAVIDQANFTGFEISEAAIAHARRRFPQAHFIQGDITQAGDWGLVPEADLVTCTDVLNHIRHTHYDDVVNMIFKSAKKTVILRMWTDDRLEGAGGYHWSHEPPEPDEFELVCRQKSANDSNDWTYYVYRRNQHA